MKPELAMESNMAISYRPSRGSRHLALSISFWLFWGVLSTASVYAQSKALKCQADSPDMATQRRVARLASEAYTSHRSLDFTSAAATYRSALAEWQRANLALQAGESMKFTDDLVGAYWQFEYAARCGRHDVRKADPRFLSRGDLERARSQLKRLRAKLGEIMVVCPQEGVAIMLDGRQWLYCPGVRREMLLVGRYRIQSEKPNHVAIDQSMTLAGGERATLRSELMSEADAYYTRFRSWQPWAVIGTGATFGLLGAGLQWRAYRNVADHDSQLGDLCEEPCSATEQENKGLPTLLERAERYQNYAASSFVLGGAVLATGLVLLFLNQKRLTHPEAGKTRIEIIEVTTSGTPADVGFNVVGRF